MCEQLVPSDENQDQPTSSTSGDGNSQDESFQGFMNHGKNGTQTYLR